LIVLSPNKDAEMRWNFDVALIIILFIYLLQFFLTVIINKERDDYASHRILCLFYTLFLIGLQLKLALVLLISYVHVLWL
jgi:cbb3-type cytochrome oxidase subunit 1